MKYLILYIFIVFTIYVYLKYYCYGNKINILNTNSLSSNSSDVKLNEPKQINIESYKPLQLSNYKNYNNYEDDYYTPFKMQNTDKREFFSTLNTENVKWKGFGTDISSKYVQQKKSEFREISTPNITIEKFTHFKNEIFKQNFHYRDNIHSITQNDINEIKMINKTIPKTIETYDNVSGKPKIKSFGLAMKTQFKSVNNLAKTFRSIRFKSDIQLPKEFNGPQIWKDYLTPITDQGKCGNCWAHASTAVLADRFAILSLGKIKFVPSPYEITICSTDFQNVDIKTVWKNEEELQKMDKKMHDNRSCNGNNLYDTANTLFTDGVTEKSCFPDKFNVNGKNVDVGNTENTNNLPYCYSITGIELDTCIDGKTPMKKYRCKTAYVCSKENDDISLKERKLMYDIYKYGPVIVGFMLFPDFVYDYDGKTIYTHKDKSGGEIGGHAVRLVGWGEETVNGELIKYWWIANSWGKDWGINGYFRMKRCIPEVQLEENIMSIIPDFPGMVIDDPNLEAVETDKEKEIQNFTGHFLDNTTGYYNTSIEKLKKCEIRGKMFPYISNSFIQYLPKYKEFFASKVVDYINSNTANIPYSNDIPIYYCDKDYTPSPSTQSPQSSTTQSPQSSTTQSPQSSTTQSPQSPANQSPNQSPESNDKINFHDKFCRIINNKYFDIVYFVICTIFGIIIYFTLYYNLNLMLDVGNLNVKETTKTINSKDNTDISTKIYSQNLSNLATTSTSITVPSIISTQSSTQPSTQSSTQPST